MADDRGCGVKKRLMIIKVGGMDQLVDLRLQRIVVGFISIPKCKYGYPCGKIQVLLAVGVVEKPLYRLVRSAVKAGDCIPVEYPTEIVSVLLFFLVETLLCITYYSSTDTFVGKEFQKL